MPLLDNEPSFHENCDGLFVKHTQVINDDLLDRLHCERSAMQDFKRGELSKVASVPTFVVELWLRQGVDVWNMTPQEVVRRLERDSLHKFIVDPKV